MNVTVTALNGVRYTRVPNSESKHGCSACCLSRNATPCRWRSLGLPKCTTAVVGEDVADFGFIYYEEAPTATDELEDSCT